MKEAILKYPKCPICNVESKVNIKSIMGYKTCKNCGTTFRFERIKFEVEWKGVK